MTFQATESDEDLVATMSLGDQSMMLAALWLEHAEGKAVIDIARDADMHILQIGVGFAALAEVLDAHLLGREGPDLPFGVVQHIAVSPETARGTLTLVFQGGKSLTELDHAMGGTPGIAAAIIGIIAARIRDDLRAHDLPLTSLEGLHALFDAERGADRVLN
jgi:hypothetical protein